MNVLFYLLIHLYASNSSELLPASDSPNAILFGLLGLLFLGVVQALCQIAWTTHGNEGNKPRQV
jgi:hypothetical protein